MRAHICRTATGNILQNAGGIEYKSGYVKIASFNGFDYYHAAPGSPLPANASAVLVNKTWADLTQTQKDRVLECIYTVAGQLDSFGNLKRFRSKRINVPVGAARLLDNLPPHRWAGDAE